MKTTLILLPDNAIIVSDEEIKEGDWYVHFGNSPNTGAYQTINQCHKGLHKSSVYESLVNPDYDKDTLFIDGMFADTCKKVIAGLPSLPTVDFNGFEGEFGLVNVKQMAEISSTLQEGTYTPQHSITYQHGFIDGFNKALSLNDKKYSLQELRDGIVYGTSLPEFREIDNYIESLSNIEDKTQAVKETAEQILSRHSKHNGAVEGNPRAIVQASEAIEAMEEYANQFKSFLTN